MNKEIAEKMTMHFCTIKNPNVMYARVWTWYQKGYIEDKLWSDFCFACLKDLMEQNKDVLDRLKNI